MAKETKHLPRGKVAMDVLLNPNVAYLILTFGLVLMALALLSPGTGLLELAALALFALVGWIIYNTSFNLWALFVLLIGAVLFILAVRWPKITAFLVLAIIFLVIGSAYLFPSDEWWKPAVNPFLALVVSGLTAVFFWFAFRKIIEARSVLPTHDLSALVGEIGNTKSEINPQGSVQIAGELWSARSEQPIPLGSQVRVIGRDGLILLVEPVESQSNF
jgi:membrane-bound serine protease (ClpP class)